MAFGGKLLGRLSCQTCVGVALCAVVAIGDGCKGSTPVAPMLPTWSNGVATFVARRCGVCHGENPIAPPSLGTYEQVRRSAGGSLLSIRRRTMPPFGADNTGLCGTWLDAPWLSDAEVTLFGQWVEAGMPAGDANPLPVAPATRPSLPASRPDVVQLDAGSFTPGLGDHATRCFLIEPSGSHAVVVSNVSVEAEPAGAVRQATLYTVAGDATIDRLHALDGADPKAGWECHGAQQIAGSHLLASWSRNTATQRLPAAAGVVAHRKKNAWVLQLHYDLVASRPGVAVHARMQLGVNDLDRVAAFTRLAVPDFTLKPGQKQVFVRATWTADKTTTLLAVVPGMNTLGRTLRIDHLRRGAGQSTEPECVAHFGHWNVYDQQLFRRATPIALSPGDEVALRCEFSTISRDVDTKMGEAPDEEQCLAHLLLMNTP